MSIEYFKIVETDNYGGDYPNEKFVQGLPFMRKCQAEIIAKAINEALNPTGSGNRYWKVVPQNYVLQPGFEP